MVFIVFIVSPGAPLPLGGTGKCPKAREAGKAPLSVPKGIFGGNQKYLSRRREYGEAERRGPPKVPNAPAEPG